MLIEPSDPWSSIPVTVSSSVMVIVTCWVPDSVPLLTDEISITTVSSFSLSESWTAVKVAVPVVPDEIVIEVELKV